MKLSDVISKEAGSVPASSSSKKKLKKFKGPGINAERFLEDHGIEHNSAVPVSDGERFDIICPFCNNKGAAVFADSEGNISGYSCLHNSCRDKHLREFITQYDPAAYDAPETLKPDDLTDAGNVQSFLIRRYGEDLLWCDALGWLHWTGQYWKRDEQSALAAALDFSDDMLAEARAVYKAAKAESDTVEADESATEDARKAAKKRLGSAIEYLSHAEKTRSKSRLEAITALAIPALARPVDAFDADPFCLCTPAGEYNLRTGELQPARKESMCTKITAVSTSDAGAEMWKDFLKKLTCDDSQLESYLQRVAGMTLIGKVFREGLILGYGSGSNGKSTFFNALQAALGDYGGSIDVKVLTTQKGKNIGPAIATLRGKRLVIAAESDENDRLSLSVIKQVTSRDQITGEEKFKAPMKFTPSHSLIMFTNFLPRIGSTDEGTWRRVAVVPFRASFKGSSDDKGFAERLQEEAGGAALAWAISGAVQFVKAGFELPRCAAVDDATSEYREESDWLGRFLEENIIAGPDLSMGVRSLYTTYKDWAYEVSESLIRTETQFRREMLSRGYHTEHKRFGSVWIGIRLVTAADVMKNNDEDGEEASSIVDLGIHPELMNFLHDQKATYCNWSYFIAGKSTASLWGEFLRWCDNRGLENMKSKVTMKAFVNVILRESGAKLRHSHGYDYFDLSDEDLSLVENAEISF